MHSILESDGVSSDPYEILCHMGTLIMEGRTPKSVGEISTSGETGVKCGKPYTEGPHCPDFMKSHSKDSQPVHKCTENNISCIRYNNLKLHLQTLQQKSSSVSIEVSLGPECLCGELRSQSTLVSAQPSKRDVILEQWTITIGHKQMREPSSQMSVLNLYQAVRSLLHFSQLTAWYMSNNGMKPANVIYRVGTPEDSTFICDDNFVSHNFPVADINKNFWMKISVKTLPRMEKIPLVFCPQHSSMTVETGHSSQEPKEKTYLNKDSLFSKFGEDKKKDLLDSSLPIKFQGVRKKSDESDERKRKKYITFYNSGVPLAIGSSSGGEFLDGMPLEVRMPTEDEEEAAAGVEEDEEEEEEYFASKRTFQENTSKGNQGESSKGDFKKSKLSTLSGDITELVKPQTKFSCNYFEQKVVDPSFNFMMGLKSFSDSKSKSDFRTKGKTKLNLTSDTSDDPKTVMDVLDDRMQISCAISGKHHCKWECEEENDLSDPEKPKRRRSISKARVTDPFEDSRLDSEKILHGKFKEIDCKSCLRLREREANAPGSVHTENFLLETPPKFTSSDCNPQASSSTKLPTPKIEGLPLISFTSEEPTPEGGSSLKKPSQTGRWIRTESFESFKKGCAFATNSLLECSSDSDDESLDSVSEKANPFLAAILRTTKKSKAKKKHCDTKVKSRGDQKMVESVKVNPCEVQSEAGVTNRRNSKGWGKNMDLKMKFNAWRKSDKESSPGEIFPNSLTGLSSLFDSEDLNAKPPNGYDDLYDEIGSNNSNSTKTIPVPSAHDKLKFRRSLDSAAQLVFHRCSGLPLTSSPAPVRRNNNSFSFDSTLNSVSAIKSALFEPSNSLSSEDENESEGSLKSPASPGAWSVGSKQINYHSLSPLPLLGTFEESVLNGRLEPVSTVQGFTAELGASGSFCPRHLHLPVTVFFYTLGDNDKVCAPYLGHINLGKKGYNVPRSGTIQVTLFNPLRTVVKMFVVVYDLHDMPPNSHTFLRQRTLYVPASQKESTWTDKKETFFDHEDYHKYLRYLIHLRFVSGKTGRIYLHTDIRMVIFRKADEDTATALDDGETYELRSHTHGPTNPKFSPKK